MKEIEMLLSPGPGRTQGPPSEVATSTQSSVAGAATFPLLEVQLLEFSIGLFWNFTT
jgi:hypothetical protein